MNEPVDLRTRDGRRLHVVDKGTGSTVVVFESGMGGSAIQWLVIQAAVAEHTRTVAYDRSGLGASDPDPEPRTLVRAAADLGDLLDAIAADSYVLVGHS